MDYLEECVGIWIKNLESSGETLEDNITQGECTDGEPRVESWGTQSFKE